MKNFIIITFALAVSISSSLAISISSSTQKKEVEHPPWFTGDKSIFQDLKGNRVIRKTPSPQDLKKVIALVRATSFSHLIDETLEFYNLSEEKDLVQYIKACEWDKNIQNMKNEQRINKKYEEERKELQEEKGISEEKAKELFPTIQPVISRKHGAVSTNLISTPLYVLSFSNYQKFSAKKNKIEAIKEFLPQVRMSKRVISFDYQSPSLLSISYFEEMPTVCLYYSLDKFMASSTLVHELIHALKHKNSPEEFTPAETEKEIIQTELFSIGGEFEAFKTQMQYEKELKDINGFKLSSEFHKENLNLEKYILEDLNYNLHYQERISNHWSQARQNLDSKKNTIYPELRRCRKKIESFEKKYHFLNKSLLSSHFGEGTVSTLLEKGYSYFFGKESKEKIKNEYNYYLETLKLLDEELLNLQKEEKELDRLFELYIKNREKDEETQK